MWSDHFLSPAFSPTPSLSAQPPLTSRCPIPGTWVYLPNLSLEHSFCIYPCAQSYLLQVLTQICSQWCFAHYFPLSLGHSLPGVSVLSKPLGFLLFLPSHPAQFHDAPGSDKSQVSRNTTTSSLSPMEIKVKCRPMAWFPKHLHCTLYLWHANLLELPHNSCHWPSFLQHFKLHMYWAPHAPG